MEATGIALVMGVRDAEARKVGDREYPASGWVTLAEEDGRSFSSRLGDGCARPAFGQRLNVTIRVHGNNRNGLSAELLSWQDAPVVVPAAKDQKVAA